MNYQEKTIAEFEKETGYELRLELPVIAKYHYFHAYSEWLLSKMETMENENKQLKSMIK